MNKESRLKEVERQINDIEWVAFWEGDKAAENRLRKLKQEKSLLETELAIGGDE